MVDILEKKTPLFDVDFTHSQLLQRTIKAFRVECYFAWVDSLEMIHIIYIYLQNGIQTIVVQATKHTCFTKLLHRTHSPLSCLPEAFKFRRKMCNIEKTLHAHANSSEDNFQTNSICNETQTDIQERNGPQTNIFQNIRIKSIDMLGM